MKKKIIFYGFLVAAGLAELKAQSVSYDQNTAYSFIGIYGTDNTGFGFGALNTTGIGPGNTATGHSALTANLGGEFNTAYGKLALNANYNGSQNVAIGFQSLMQNACASCAGGHRNTATGHNAMMTNTDGSDNSANGPNVLAMNITGSYNTGIGYNALYSNNMSGSFGNSNTAIGHSALASCDDCENSTAVGSRSMLNFMSAKRSTAFGYATGGLGGTSSAPFDDNTMIGYRAMANAGGNQNTALGMDAMYNSGGDMNTAVGVEALYTNLSIYNVAVGRDALYNNPRSDGIGNTAVGLGAIKYNSSSYLGSPAFNTALGGGLFNCYGGQLCTSAGAGALAYSGLGSQHLSSTILGPWSDLSAACTNATSIGFAAIVNNTNKLRAGNVSVTTVETQLSYSWPSDGRFKYNVEEDDVKGIAFIKKLRPVTYNFDTRKFTEFLAKNMVDSAKTHMFDTDFEKSTALTQSGFIAQEVKKAADESEYDFNGVHIPETENDNYSVSYEQFVVPLVKAIQEQQQLLEQQRAVTNSLEQELNAGKRLIAEIKDQNLVNGLVEDLVEPGYSLAISYDSAKAAYVISYTAPETSDNKLYIALYDASGKQVQTVPVKIQNSDGASKVVVPNTTGQLSVCSLISDGKVMGTKTIVGKL